MNSPEYQDRKMFMIQQQKTENVSGTLNRLNFRNNACCSVSIFDHGRTKSPTYFGIISVFLHFSLKTLELQVEALKNKLNRWLCEFSKP